MLATDTKYPNTAQVAVATGQRGTLEAQTKNPASDRGHQAIGSGAAHQMAGDVGRAPMPLPSAPAGSASENLGGYTPTGRAGVYRQGNSFTDEAGTRGAIQTSGPVGRTAAQAVMTSPSVPSPQPVNSNVAALQRLTGQAPAGAAVPVTQQINAASTLAAGPGANQQALARLQANNATSAPASGMSAVQQLTAPTVAHSGNDWEARNNLRSLRVSANSLSNEPRWGGMGAKSPDVQAYLAAVETDNAARQGKNPLAQELLQQQGGIVRTGMQEAGATGRTVMGEAGANARAVMTGDIQRGELALKQETAGIANSAAQQLAQVQQNYLNAKTPQERAQAAQAIRVLTGKDDAPTAPSGYRWTQQGSLQPIAGGPADRSRDPKLTEDQGKAAGFAVRMENSLNLLNGISQTNPSATRPGVGTALLNTLPEGVANLARTEDRQRVEAAQLDALDAALTLGTGAAYTKEQLESYRRSYFAQPGDGDQVVKEKQDRLASLIETARLRAGPQGNQMADAALERGRQGAHQPQQPAGQPQPAQIPQAGEVRKGFRFKGGDPADRNNWEAVQ